MEQVFKLAQDGTFWLCLNEANECIGVIYQRSNLVLFSSGLDLPFIETIIKRLDESGANKLKSRIPLNRDRASVDNSLLNLKTLGFYEVGIEHMENLLQGQWTDILLFERLHPQWQQPVGQELEIGVEEELEQPPEPKEPELATENIADGCI